MSFVGIRMKSITPNRGVITKIEPCEASIRKLYDFITCNRENVITLWKIKVIDGKNITLNMLEDIQLEQQLDHIAIHADVIAVAVKQNLTMLQLLQKKNGGFSLQYHKHTKDERHRAKITQVGYI